MKGMNDFFASTVDESLIDSTNSAFNNIDYDITDKQTTKWRKNSNKTSKNMITDRFIPVRDENKFDQQQTYHHHDHDANNNENKHELIQNEKDKKDKILTFKNNAPEPSDGYISSLRVLYTLNNLDSNNNESNSCHSNMRHISCRADRVLDAPDLMDDYYLNILDWGSTNNIIAIGLGSCLYFWNSANGEINLCRDYGSNGSDIYISSVSFNHNCQYIAIGSSDNMVTLYDVSTFKLLRKISGHQSRIGSLSWNHSILSTGSADSCIRNNDVRCKQYLISMFKTHEQEICGLKWNNNNSGKYLVSGSNDNKVCVFDINMVRNNNNNQNEQQQNLALFEFTESLSAVKALAFCPWNNNLLATGGGSGDRKIRIYDISTGSNGNLCKQIDTKSQVTSLIWNPFEKEILSSHGFSKNQLSIWKYPKMIKTHDLIGHNSRILHTTLSPNGQIVCSAAADETLRFWNVFENKSQSINQSNQSINHKNNNTSSNSLNLRIR